MRKRFIAYTLCISLAVLFIQTRVVAQQVEPVGVNDVDTNRVVEEKLVRIAMRRPSYDAVVHSRASATHALSKAKNDWLNLLAISMQFNETDFEKQPVAAAGTTAIVYPKYFFGLNIPIGILFSRSSDIRIARENIAIADDNQAEAARAIRADVVGKYRNYVNYQEQIRLETGVVNDEQVAFEAVQKDFKDGKIALETYNTASKAYTMEITRKLNLQMQSDNVKTELEEALGMHLEDALRR